MSPFYSIARILTVATVGALLLLPRVSADACGVLAQALSQSRGFEVAPNLAYQCMKSIPLDKDFALNMTSEVRRYLDYYSSGTYFKHNVTPELDIETVDINKTMDNIAASIKAGKYANFYDVGRDIFHLFGAVKDGHVKFIPACVAGSFVFYHDWSLTQVANTSTSIPEIYTVSVNANTHLPVLGRKVSKINGQDAAAYLEDMAKHHPEASWIDPDARFNELLLHIEAMSWHIGVFAVRRLYDIQPLTLTFSDGTKVNVTWKAVFVNPRADAQTHPIPFADATTFWNTICVRSDSELDAVLSGEIPNPEFHYPEIPREFTTGSSSTHHPKREPKSWVGASKPNILPPEVLIPIRKKESNKRAASGRGFLPSSLRVGTTENSEIAFYMLDRITAVLLVSAFATLGSESDEHFIRAFSQSVGMVIKAAKDAGATRLIIDVSGNGGGIVVLGQNMIRQLFPNNNKIFFGSNMHWNPTLDAMFTLGDQQKIANSFFDLDTLRRVDDTDFKNFRDMLGPVHRDDDLFTHIAIPDEVDQGTDAGGQLFVPSSAVQPFKTENIILVSSGLCGSTCAVFAEVMRAQGARIVAFGGRPRKGPMQGVGGIKGSQVLYMDDIASYTNYFLDSYMQSNPKSSITSSVPQPLRLRTVVASVNFRNSWRKDDGQYLPIEFLYTPANWRLFYTADMFQAAEVLHGAARDVAWDNGPDVSGGEYIPINGLDGSGFKWPAGSHSAGAGGGGAGTNSGKGKKSGASASVMLGHGVMAMAVALGAWKCLF